MYLEHQLPCLYCHPHRYIRMVHHLIERCLLLGMTRDDCVKGLAVHAKIHPLITLTVWKELIKENRDFFRAYYLAISPRPLKWTPVHRVSRFRRRKQWKSM